MPANATRPLVIIGAFAASLVVGLSLMFLMMGGGRNIAAPAAIGGPFQLTDQGGAVVTEQSLQGRPTLIFFGFTHCPEFCPTTVYELTGWMNKIDPDKSRIQAYFISIDPERDTPQILGAYLANATDRITGISGDPAKVQAMARGFKVYFKKVPTDPAKPDGDYTMDHMASVFLLDKQGRFTGTIAYGENPDIAEQKIKNLIARD